MRSVGLSHKNLMECLCLKKWRKKITYNRYYEYQLCFRCGIWYIISNNNTVKRWRYFDLSKSIHTDVGLRYFDEIEGRS
jgi:hypothetical protein